MSKMRGRTLDGLTFPMLRVAVQEIRDWRWYATCAGKGQPMLVRRLGDRIAEIDWDGEWWRWRILDKQHAVLMRGQGGRLTEALVEAETAQPYQMPLCPTWCQVDHSKDLNLDDYRFHYIEDEITVGEGRHVAAVCTSYASSPSPESHGAPTICVSGLDERSLTAAEAEALRVALARAIDRLQEVEQVYTCDGEQRRQASIRQRTDMAMRAFAPPLSGEDAGDRRAA